MRSWGKLPALTAVLAGLVFAASGVRSAPVVLHLKNGDRLTGEIVSESAQRLVLKSASLGRVKVSMDEIARRESPGVVAPGPGGAIPAPAKTAAVAVAPPRGGLVTTNAMATNGPMPSWYAPAWVRPLLTNWHGGVQIGMDLGFGTTDRQTFYANANANHAYNRFRNNLTLRSAYGIAEGPVSALAPDGTVQTANSLEGLLKTDFDLGARRKIYLYHQAGAGFDEIRRYDLRFEDGVGVGYKLVGRPRLLINTEVGGQFQHLSYLNSPRLLPFLEDHDVFSVRFGENITWKITDKFSITHRLQITPNVEDPGDFRARFELSMSYPLLKRVSISLNVFDEYESRPAGLVENNQLQIQSTLGVTF